MTDHFFVGVYANAGSRFEATLRPGDWQHLEADQEQTEPTIQKH